jgi:hypothetical protein
MTSTGIAVSFPRDLWPRTKSRPEFGKAGVYVLVGFSSDDDLPTLYIGQGDGTRSRIAAHYDQKDFWDWGVVFSSKASDAGLNRAHITWLEHALIKRAKKRDAATWTTGIPRKSLRFRKATGPMFRCS